MLRSKIKSARAYAALIVVAALSLTGAPRAYAGNPALSGIVGPTITNSDGLLTMAVVFKNLNLEEGFSFAVPKLSNSYFTLGPDVETNGSVMQLTIDSTDMSRLVKGVLVLDPQYLPGQTKRPIPVISGGAMPGFAFQIEKLGKLAIYGGKNLFGIFVPVKLGLKDMMGTFRFKMGKTNVGTFSIVGKGKAGYDLDPSGFLLMLNMKVVPTNTSLL